MSFISGNDINVPDKERQNHISLRLRGSMATTVRLLSPTDGKSGRSWGYDLEERHGFGTCQYIHLKPLDSILYFNQMLGMYA